MGANQEEIEIVAEHYKSGPHIKAHMRSLPHRTVLPMLYTEQDITGVHLI
jgi:hypothetical protein